jgi:hypothetical protein
MNGTYLPLLPVYFRLAMHPGATMTRKEIAVMAGKEPFEISAAISVACKYKFIKLAGKRIVHGNRVNFYVAGENLLAAMRESTL